MLLDRPRVEQGRQAPATFDGDNIDDEVVLVRMIVLLAMIKLMMGMTILMR